jgi:hypothetical protein
MVVSDEEEEDEEDLKRELMKLRSLKMDNNVPAHELAQKLTLVEAPLAILRAMLNLEKVRDDNRRTIQCIREFIRRTGSTNKKEDKEGEESEEEYQRLLDEMDEDAFIEALSDDEVDLEESDEFEEQEEEEEEQKQLELDSNDEEMMKDLEDLNAILN